MTTETPTPRYEKIGPFDINVARPFSISDLNKIGPWSMPDGTRVFVDYDGTNNEWYSYPLQHSTVSEADAARQGLYTSRDTQRTRRAVLKAMVTRRANKARREARQVQS